MSLFLEGLLNKTLNVNLYSKKHGTLNECILDAIDLDDNCDIFGNVSLHLSGTENSTIKGNETSRINHANTTEAIAEEVMKKLNIAMRLPQRQAQMRILGQVELAETRPT